MGLIEKLEITVNDIQPYYYAQAKDSDDEVINLSGATIRCTMKLVSDGTLKIDRQTTGITISVAASGLFHYIWQSGDTDTVGIYYIEFEITPSSGGKFTLPQPHEGKAVVEIVDSLDTI